MGSKFHYHEDATEHGEIPPRVKAIMDLGVAVHFDDEWVHGEGSAYPRHPVVMLDRVTSVRAPFTDTDWVGIAQREGDHYVGGCCGNMSALQDHINGVFRDDGAIDAGEFRRIAHYARGHEGFEDWEPVDDEQFDVRMERMRKNGMDAFSPWSKLGMVFLAVEDYLEPPPSMDLPSLETPREKERDDTHVVKTAADALQYMAYEWLFGDDDQLSHEAQRKLARAKLLPTLRELVAKIEQAGVEFDGFALVAEDSGEVYTDRHGPCIYTDRESAEATVREWEKHTREEDRMNANHEKHDMERLGRLALRVAEGNADAAKQFEEEKQRILERKGFREYDFWSSRRAKIVAISVTVADGLVIHPERAFPD
jgi:hypothetical protein